VTVKITLFAVSCLPFAFSVWGQVNPIDAPMGIPIGNWANVGAIVVLCMLVYWMTVKGNPMRDKAAQQRETDHDELIRSITETFTNTLQKITENFNVTINTANQRYAETISSMWREEHEWRKARDDHQQRNNQMNFNVMRYFVKQLTGKELPDEDLSLKT
jgi:hypothetical protein